MGPGYTMLRPCAKGEAVGIKAVETCHYRSTFYSLNPRSVTLVSEV